MSDSSTGYWPAFVRRLRQREGLSQAALSARLGVNQTAISRWERGVDQPGLRLRRRLRDMFRANHDSRRDAAMRLRVQFAGWPTSLVRRGAVFLETSPSLNAEIGAHESVKGCSIYGRFGLRTDEVTRDWERTGIFDGELAMTLSLNEVQTPQGLVYYRGLDTPYFAQNGEVWCLCEIKRIDRAEYLSTRAQIGGSLMTVPFDYLGA